MQAEALGDGGGDHSRASGTYLTGVHVRKSDSVVENGISMDQIAAKAFERETQLSSLQLTDGRQQPGRILRRRLQLRVQQHALVAHADAAADGREQSARGVRAAVRLERQHRSARARGAPAAGPEHSRFGDRSREAAAAEARHAPTTAKVNDYLTSLRDVERRIQKAEEQSAKEMPDVAQPAGIPDSFEQHVALLYDLQLLAYQSDLTRVITFMYGREQTGRPYPQIGVPEPHHPMTHHQNDPEKMEKCATIQLYHLKLFAEYLEKLRNTPDGDGSLLDHVILLYGAGISNSDRHTHGPLPTLLARRRRRSTQGRPSPRLSGTHAADEPAADAAQQARRSRREARRSTGEFKELSEL